MDADANDRSSGFFVRAPRDSRGDVSSELLRRARYGDRVALDELVQCLMPPLRRFLWRRMSAGEDAEDVLQESLLAVLAALPGFRGEGSVVHFGIQVSRRLMLSVRRSRRRRDERTLRVSRLQLPLVTLPPEPHEVFLERRCASELHKLFLELPGRYTDGVAGAMASDRSLADVATTMGIPLNTLRSRLRRARRYLRWRIEADSVLAELLAR